MKLPDIVFLSLKTYLSKRSLFKAIAHIVNLIAYATVDKYYW